MLAAFNLNSCLIEDPVVRPRLFNFNERTGHVLAAEDNFLQDDLNSLHAYSSEKMLKIKESKTQIMKFNSAKTLDFPPELYIEGFSDLLEVTRETKLLGLMVTDDLKWEANTNYICAKAYKKMWTLRRMKVLDLEPYVMLDVYAKEIRSLLELAVPAWHSGLTKHQQATIERVQKVAVSVILSDSNTGICDYSYDMALVILDLEPLDVRREKLCGKFANQTLKSRHGDMFKHNQNLHYTRAKSKFFKNRCNTKRFYNSPLNYLTRLLNSLP